MVPEVFFHPAADGGHRLYVHHVPAPSEQPPRGAVLYVHPFAEEMNKSRRMAALQSRALARAGFEVLQIDLLGCGDSSGEFGDATWDEWLADVVEATHWLRERAGAPLWLWGLRAGCLLAAAAASRVPCNLLFWHPVTAGRLALQQFLRLKAAAQLADGSGKSLLAGLKSDLAAGKPVEVAGYVLHPRLASGLEAAALAPAAAQDGAVGATPPRASRVIWREVSTQADTGLSAAAATALARWTDAGFAVDLRVVPGPLFWQTTEIEDAPALIASSIEALLQEPSVA